MSGRGERITHGGPVRNDVTLFNDQDDLFMGLFLLDILQHRFAHRSNWTSSIEYHVEDDIRKVNDTVKLTICPPWGSFRVNPSSIYYMTAVCVVIDGFLRDTAPICR